VKLFSVSQNARCDTEVGKNVCIFFYYRPNDRLHHLLFYNSLYILIFKIFFQQQILLGFRFHHFILCCIKLRSMLMVFLLVLFSLPRLPRSSSSCGLDFRSAYRARFDSAGGWADSNISSTHHLVHI
jgi:hypothetical protein